MEFQGKVVRRSFAPGSKSEHEGIALQTAEGPLKLRRPEGNPFRDPVLENLVGREIVCEGDLHAGQILLRRWSVVAK
jgi:hypothetical protein